MYIYDKWIILFKKAGGGGYVGTLQRHRVHIRKQAIESFPDQ